MSPWMDGVVPHLKLPIERETQQSIATTEHYSHGKKGTSPNRHSGGKAGRYTETRAADSHRSRFLWGIGWYVRTTPRTADGIFPTTRAVLRWPQPMTCRTCVWPNTVRGSGFRVSERGRSLAEHMSARNRNRSHPGALSNSREIHVARICTDCTGENIRNSRLHASSPWAALASPCCSRCSCCCLSCCCISSCSLRSCSCSCSCLRCARRWSDC